MIRLKPNFGKYVSAVVVRIYEIEDARSFLTERGLDVDRLAPQVEGRFASAFIRARKPSGCCDTTCCK